MYKILALFTVWAYLTFSILSGALICVFVKDVDTLKMYKQDILTALTKHFITFTHSGIHSS